MPRYRNFVFTINNYTDDDINKMKSCDYRYLVYGFEKVSTPHLQGYCELNLQMRLSALTRYFPRAHIEPRRGTAQEAADYCKKDCVFEEFGTLSNPGKRKDIVVVRDMVKSGKRLRQIADEVSSFQALQFARTIIPLYKQHRKDKPTVIWIYGPPGIGKTRYVFDRHPIEDIYVYPNMKFWEGYECQPVCLIDDYRDTPSHRELLVILDRYPHTVNLKFGSCPFNSSIIYITSPHPPSHYVPIGEDPLQLLRRIDSVVDMVGTTITPTSETTSLRQIDEGPQPMDE